MVYGKHLKDFLLLAVVIQIPFSFILWWTIGTEWWNYLILSIAIILLGALVYGAGIYAVGQQYVTRKVDVVQCYQRVQWRLLSLLWITVAIAGMFIGGAALVPLIVPFIVGMVFTIYWSVAQQASIIEGHKYAAALNRSQELVRGQWWRVFGITITFLLVGIGLTLVIIAPFLIAMTVVGTGSDSMGDGLLRFFGILAAGTVVSPILAIAWTLLYYDLRVRKEDYDLGIMSQELGLELVEA